jgi:hypothetical protein
MRIVGVYSFNGGSKFVQEHFSDELEELKSAIQNIDAEKYKTKISKEKTVVPPKIRTTS